MQRKIVSRSFSACSFDSGGLGSGVEKKKKRRHSGEISFSSAPVNSYADFVVQITDSFLLFLHSSPLLF